MVIDRTTFSSGKLNSRRTAAYSFKYSRIRYSFGRCDLADLQRAPSAMTCTQIPPVDMDIDPILANDETLSDPGTYNQRAGDTVGPLWPCYPSENLADLSSKDMLVTKAERELISTGRPLIRPLLQFSHVAFKLPLIDAV